MSHQIESLLPENLQYILFYLPIEDIIKLSEVSIFRDKMNEKIIMEFLKQKYNIGEICLNFREFVNGYHYEYPGVDCEIRYGANQSAWAAGYRMNMYWIMYYANYTEEEIQQPYIKHIINGIITNNNMEFCEKMLIEYSSGMSIDDFSSLYIHLNPSREHFLKMLIKYDDNSVVSLCEALYHRSEVSSKIIHLLTKRYFNINNHYANKLLYAVTRFCSNKKAIKLLNIYPNGQAGYIGALSLSLNREQFTEQIKNLNLDKSQILCKEILQYLMIDGQLEFIKYIYEEYNVQPSAGVRIISALINGNEKLIEFLLPRCDSKKTLRDVLWLSEDNEIELYLKHYTPTTEDLAYTLCHSTGNIPTLRRLLSICRKHKIKLNKVYKYALRQGMIEKAENIKMFL